MEVFSALIAAARVSVPDTAPISPALIPFTDFKNEFAAPVSAFNPMCAKRSRMFTGLYYPAFSIFARLNKKARHREERHDGGQGLGKTEQNKFMVFHVFYSVNLVYSFRILCPHILKTSVRSTLHQ